MVTCKMIARFGLSFACLTSGLFVLAAWGQRMVVPHSQTISTLDGIPVLEAGIPSARPYLGLTLYETPPESCQSRCLVAIPRPGPVSGAFRKEFLEVPVLRLLAIDDREIRSTAEFRQWMRGLSIGAEVRLRFFRRYPKPETETTITVRVGSWEDWAAPIDHARPPQQRIAPESVVPGPSEPTLLETLLQNQLDLNGIAIAAAETRKHLVRTMENNYAPGMLSRVAYGFYRPARLAELQKSITEPLVNAVEQNQGQPFEVMRPVLRGAAKNLDLRWTPGERGRLDITSPRQALRDAAVMLHCAHAHLEAAFRGIGEDARRELTLSAPGLLDPARWAEPAVVRARRASLAIDYASILAAADSIAAWDVQGTPPPLSGPPHVALPSELRDAVKGDVLAVERIDGRWYVYGGNGPNQYDLSRIDVVIDPGGNDLYRYPRSERPRVQLVVDWDGDDRYLGENGAAGPASGLLGVSVVVDRAGNDRYEGGDLSCGAGLMGAGLILDLAGNDSYKGTRWTQGAAKYGFGVIVDLGSGADTYLVHELGQGVGGPRGFGLILDQGGNDLYRANGQVPSVWGLSGIYSGRSQGFGTADFAPGIGAFDVGGIGLLCDLDGDDRYEVGELGQGTGFFYGLGVLYDRRGRDLYYGSNYSQATSAHGGVGILADDAGDDTYWGGIAGAWDSGLALLIDRGGNDSYQSYRGGGVGEGAQQGIAFLIDLDGQDRYNVSPRTVRALSESTDRSGHEAAAYDAAGIGESSPSDFNYAGCRCFSLSVFIDAGGTSDLYSRSDRGDGMSISTGKANPWWPEYGTLYGLFIDTKEKVKLWR